VVRLLEFQAIPTWASLVVAVAVVRATVFAAPLAARREVLGKAALGEVVPVGGVELAPFVAVPMGWSRLPLASRRVSPR